MSSVARVGGHSVMEASDGERALEIMRAGSVDVVLLDLMLPKMNGF